MANSKRFEDQQLWSKAADLTCRVFDLTRNSNVSNCGLLHDELQYNALLISSLIAEAYEKGGSEEIRLMQEARGKCGALCSKLYVCADLNLITEKDVITILKQCRSISSEIGNIKEQVQRKPKPQKTNDNRKLQMKTSRGMGEMDTAEFVSYIRGKE